MRKAILLLAATAIPTGAVAMPGVTFSTEVLVNEASVRVGSGPTENLTPDANDDIFAFRTYADGASRGAATVDVRVDATGGGFYFHHNLIGCGETESAASLVFAIDLTNTTGSAVTGKFLSKVLPGHVGVRNDGPNLARASYTFGVYLDRPFPQIQGLSSTTANGASHNHVDQEIRPAFEIQGDGLNSYTVYQPDASVTAADWGETNLGLTLTIGAGRTRTIFYTLDSAQSQSGPCLDGTTCQASQLLFADPREGGGGGGPSAIVADAVEGTPPRLPLDYCTDVGRINPIVGQPYEDPVLISFEFVDPTTPLAPNPIYVPPSYGIDIEVPAPAALGLLGLGVLGIALRRRG